MSLTHKNCVGNGGNRDAIHNFSFESRYIFLMTKWLKKSLELALTEVFKVLF